MPKEPETIDLTLTWRQAAEIAMLALENGTPEGKRMAREEIRRMAAALDSLREGQGT